MHIGFDISQTVSGREGCGYFRGCLDSLFGGRFFAASDQAVPELLRQVVSFAIRGFWLAGVGRHAFRLCDAEVEGNL